MRACLPTIIGAASRLSGVHAIKAIRAEFLDARVIALTTYEGDEAIYRERGHGQIGARSSSLEQVRLNLRRIATAAQR
jgi:hypothetical protein